MIKMTKKIFIALALLWLIFGITKVKALSKNEKFNVINQRLDSIIEIKNEDKWQDLEIEKYVKENTIIYKLGNNSLGQNEITVGNNVNDNRITRIIKSNTKERIFFESGIKNEEDKYIATKIAIDSISNGYTSEKIKNYYRAKEFSNEIAKIRANNIIKSAEKLIDLGYTGEETFTNIVNLYRIGELTKDNMEKNYSSQEYKVEVEDGNLLGYKIIEKSYAPVNYYIANTKDGKGQEVFGSNEKEFKVMVPEDEIEDIFTINLKVEICYETEKLLEGTDGTNKYIILSKEIENSVMDAQLRNGYSSLNLNFIDEETDKKIYGCVVEIQGNRYEIKEQNQEILNDILKSDIQMKIIYIPDEYYIENEELQIEINHKERHIENIKLKHKKGNLDITTKAGEATYEIYDDEANLIGTYETDQQGKVYIENIDIGNYTIKQTKVKKGYQLVEDSMVPILHNETCYVTIVNQEEEKKPDEPEKPKEEDKKDEGKGEEINPPKEDQNVEPPEQIEEPKEDKEQDKKDEIEEKTDNKEHTNEDKTPEKIEESEEEKKHTQEESKEENNKSNTLFKKEEQISTLPRTGNDYFIFKILLADIIIFLLIVFLSHLYSNKNKTRLSKEQVTKKI